MNNLRFAGDYKLQKATLLSYNGSQVDITNLIAEITLFEDIFSPFMTLDILIEDQVGLYHKLPIVGEELIELTIQNVDGQGGITNLAFSLYKTKDFIEKGSTGFVYTLCFISPEAIVDMNLKISKAYSGTASDIAKMLLKKEGLTTAKNIYVEESTGKISYISNYWSPIRNFKYLTQRAVSKDTNSPSYLFFENKYGFFFSSLAALKCQDPVTSFSYIPRTDQDVEKSTRRVEKIYVDRGIDYIEKVQTGGYGSNAIYVDPTRKSYRYRYLDFIEAFDKQVRLNENAFGTTDATRRVNGSFHVAQADSYVQPGMKSEQKDAWFQERMLELGASRAFEVHLEIPGSMEIAVGQTTDFFMYSGDRPKSDNLGDVLDPIFSGRYIVSGIRHTFTRKKHTMIISIIKDSIVGKEQK